MITLDVIRHGPALPASATGDDGRVLSADGRELVRRLGERLAKDDWAPLPAFVSPLIRARQTAEILASFVPGGLPLIVLPELAPDGDPGTLVAALAPLLERDSHSVVIGHQPMLGELVALLSGTGVSLAASGLVRLQGEEPLAPGGAGIALTLQPPAFR